MNSDPKVIEALVDAMATAMELSIPEVGKPVVIEHLQVAFRMAPLVLDFPLDDEQEPAPVFTP